MIRHDYHIREQLLGLSGHSPFSKSDRRKMYCWFACFPILLVLVVQLTFVPALIAQIIRNHINNAFIFTQPDPANPHYRTWVTNAHPGSVPIHFSIQFFNITNSERVLQGEMPQLDLTGPLFYNQYYWRKNVTFTEDGYFVSHRYHTQYLLSVHVNTQSLLSISCQHSFELILFALNVGSTRN